MSESSATSAGEAAIIEEASLALLEVTLGALSRVASVSVLQMRALAVVDRHGPINLSALAERLDQSVSSASRLVDRLVEAGLTRREVASHSRRENAIVLSAKGHRALSRLRRHRQTAMAPILDRMTADDRAALSRGLVAFTGASDGPVSV